MSISIGIISLLYLFVGCTPTEPKVAPPAPVPKDTMPAVQYTLDYLMGKFEPSTHPDFTLISTAYANREGMYMRKDAYAAFQRMHAAAREAGVKLSIVSAARNFSRQQEIWEAKWNGARAVGGQNIAETIPDPVLRALKILEYSSMPGSSRHHWGTDIDINALTDSYFTQGEGKKVYAWLSRYAVEYGFCQPYTPFGTDRSSGYFEEKWHWSYMPISSILTRQAEQQLTDEMITGFKGAETAKKIKLVEKYVLGIHPNCY